MSEFFTKEGLCFYLARKLVPSQLEFQIRKLADKSRGYVYDRHLFGGYEICFNKNELSPRMIYVDLETLAYEVCLENEESKKGTLPDKFLNLKDDYRKDRFKVLLNVLEAIASDDFLITCNKPEEISDFSAEYQEIFNCRSHNPDDASMLTSEDIDEILKRCENRYNVFLCDNFDKIEDKEIEEWTIYIEKNNFVYHSSIMDEDLKEKFDERTSGYNNHTPRRRYKFRGRNGRVCQDFLFACDIEDLETKEKTEIEISVDILMEISSQHPKDFYYFNTRYIDSVVANNPDKFRKLLYILNGYGDEIGFKLVRVITESNNLVYQQQIKKYKELLESEFDALVADGKIIPLTDKLYKLKIKHDVYGMIDDQRNDPKEADRIYFPEQHLFGWIRKASEIWAESNGMSVDHINTYRHARKIFKIIYEALRIGELKLHDQLTQAIIEYSNNSELLGTVPLVCLDDILLLLNKNYVDTSWGDKIFTKEQVQIEIKKTAETIEKTTLDDREGECDGLFQPGRDPFKIVLKELHAKFYIPEAAGMKRVAEKIWNHLQLNITEYRVFIKSISPWTDTYAVITFTREDIDGNCVTWKKRTFEERVSELNRDKRDAKIKASSQGLALQ